MTLIIRKKVSLEFLGDEYKDSYIIAKAISLDEFNILKKSDETIGELVKTRIIEGKIKQDNQDIDITKENAGELPGEVFTYIWTVLTGIDPNLAKPSTTSSVVSTNAG